MLKKYLLIFSVLVLSSISLTFAENQDYVAPTYSTVDAPALDFVADYTDGKVKLSWQAEQLDLSDTETWKYRKVIRSQKNSNPVYPDDGYIHYAGELTTNSYIDTQAPVGTNYYRVCAITKKVDANYRYCSHVKSLTLTEEQVHYKKELKTYDYTKTTAVAQKVNSYTMSHTMRDRMDLIFDNFLERLDTKHSDDIEAKIERLQMIREKLTAVIEKTSSSKIKIIFTHILEKIEEHLAFLSLEQILD